MTAPQVSGLANALYAESFHIDWGADWLVVLPQSLDVARRGTLAQILAEHGCRCDAQGRVRAV
jgi:hypothetical protein